MGVSTAGRTGVLKRGREGGGMENFRKSLSLFSILFATASLSLSLSLSLASESLSLVSH